MLSPVQISQFLKGLVRQKEVPVLRVNTQC